ncbi:MAG: spore cortex biosynthesis protein YabQ [Oscillospiraceae bacterium]|nr:spore cortex biosynthesis protein YabQ [Oscillospiraceae bacterium]
MTAPIPDTFWTTQEELTLFGGSCLLGIPAGLLFDVFRLFRRAVRHPALAVAAEDTLWLTGVSLILLFYASACAKGVFRAYYAAGCLIGFVLYELTLGEPTVRMLDLLLRIVCAPLRWFGRRITSICTKIKGRFVRIIQKCRGRQENHKKPLQAHGKKLYNNKRHVKKGSIYGKSKTHGQTPASGQCIPDPHRAGAHHHRMHDRIHQHAELHRGKKARARRAE